MSKFKKQGTWRLESPNRTNTGSTIRGKISAPIPIPDDDEFPIRTPGTGIATPLGAEGPEKQLRTSAIPRRNSSIHPAEGVAVADFVEPAVARSIQNSARPSYESPIHQTRKPSPLRNSAGSAVPSKSSNGKPQRKKSTFRSVFGKLFGKKKPNRQSAETTREHRQHRSDPTALNRSPTGTANSQKRSVSLPINEFNRALRSHSAVLEAFPQTEPTRETNRESVQSQTRPRRATTPSRLWTPNKTPGYVDWTGLSPRPASSHARQSLVFEEAGPYEGIGQAITSGSHPHRRSRSLGQLREEARAHAVPRRRSDEIRYWRESYDAGILSPLSSRGEAVEAGDTTIAEDPDLPRDTESRDQPQPFDFGPLGEMAGMKITQAANLQTRVSRLESRMSEMEKRMSQVLRRVAADPIALQDPPKNRRDRSLSTTRPGTDTSDVSLPKQSRHRQRSLNFSESQNRAISYDEHKPSLSTHNSYHPDLDNSSLASSDPNARLPSQNATRPLSTSTTIRGMPSSSPTTVGSSGLTFEHFTALNSMITAEQAARQRLEAVVSNLQDQLETFLRGSSSGGFPIQNLQAEPLIQEQVLLNSTSFSTFDQDDSSEEGGGPYGQEDVFQTPNEEKGYFEDEVFGKSKGESRGEEEEAGRAMSMNF